MTDSTIPVTDPKDAVLTFEQKLEAADPVIAAEYTRLALWVETCIGADVAKVGGKSIEE